jgi:hypothetical protein
MVNEKRKGLGEIPCGMLIKVEPTHDLGSWLPRNPVFIYYYHFWDSN